MIDFLWMDEENPVSPALIGLEAHLGLDLLRKLMFGRFKELRFPDEQLLKAFTTNPDVIQNRQLVIQDLLNNPELAERLTLFYNQVSDWQRNNSSAFAAGDDLLENVFSVDLIFDFFDALDQMTAELKQAADQASLRSPWLHKLLDYLVEVVRELNLAEFEEGWKSHAAPVKKLQSFQIGLNFDDLVSVTNFKLLKLGSETYQPCLKTFQNKLENFLMTNGYYLFKTTKFQELVGIVMMGRETELDDLDLLPHISNEVLSIGAEGLHQQIRWWMRTVLARLTPLQDGLAFYIGGQELVRRLQEGGGNVCFPTAAEGKCFTAKGLYNPFLIDAERRSDVIVSNDISLGQTGEIGVVTGANEGGKTTYLVSVALAQFLFQLGLPVPADSAEISIASAMALVFASAEQNLHVSGRLGQELAELSNVLKNVRNNDVFFAFNEPLTGTSSQDSLTIMTDVLSVMKASGARGLLVTHLFSLADEIDRLNKLIGGSKLKSMIVLVEPGLKPLYKIVEGQPGHTSYAREAYQARIQS